MEQNNEQKFTVTCPEAEVEKRIREYMGSSLKKLDICMFGRTADVRDLAYENFKPVRQVKRDLEDMIPNVEFSSIERTYSDDKYYMILEELFEKRVEVYIQEKDDSLKKTELFWLFEDELRHRTFND